LFSDIDERRYPSPLQRVEQSLKTSMPWLVLAGSGGVADLLSDILETVSPAPPSSGSPAEGEGEAAPSVDLRERVGEHVRMRFPGNDDLDKLVDQVTTSLLTRDSSPVTGPTDSQVPNTTCRRWSDCHGDDGSIQRGNTTNTSCYNRCF